MPEAPSLLLEKSTTTMPMSETQISDCERKHNNMNKIFSIICSILIGILTIGITAGIWLFDIAQGNTRLAQECKTSTEVLSNGNSIEHKNIVGDLEEIKIDVKYIKNHIGRVDNNMGSTVSNP